MPESLPRFMTLSKDRPSSPRPKVCLLKFFRVPGSVSLSTQGIARSSQRRHRHLKAATSYLMTAITCEIFESIIKLDIDLTCSICLETVFDPVSLTCGHIFCYMCACSAASVTIIDGLKAAEAKGKCPLCREVGVFDGAVHLDELNILLSQSCHEYWEQRHQRERVERIQQAKQ
ncbi:hypothetical protein CMV_021531 [Castanea mollissima]|uniref:RING-type domain-containing protein n=1 Tax=Castanea mollissima TaxID=60419 RepID=A0A8J4QU00_9ROSI|nr:hypothetical protein CMV_021531 [Castanea mollissima]